MLEYITVENAKKILLDETNDMKQSVIPILDSMDHVLAEDIISETDIPPFDRSPLDGYAFKSEDCINATEHSPVTLEVIDNIHAGYVSSKKISKGQAIRIMTGAKYRKGQMWL